MEVRPLFLPLKIRLSASVISSLPTAQDLRAVCVALISHPVENALALVLY